MKQSARVRNGIVTQSNKRLRQSELRSLGGHTSDG